MIRPRLRCVSMLCSNPTAGNLWNVSAASAGSVRQLHEEPGKGPDAEPDLLTSQFSKEKRKVREWFEGRKAMLAKAPPIVRSWKVRVVMEEYRRRCAHTYGALWMRREWPFYRHVAREKLLGSSRYTSESDKKG
uniref:Uncharacterized protein n=1 Tax=Chromera velia CCMP2878 TaxID=1169474 RepID=A0A0G4I5I5_9ALVE|eukprot:Cvel_11187.t1-p1 / transcript=Cvel_11187.t1 / gene=Cvel_11187 / organism=Chromera_velia_CCMP2878 / gene_product=hypothetical protein / transcript_product=hypothetical protein / location=Cvel_scaffold694:60157-62546(-) / protein_length=133 / sequence_SO=supercontig / SO=protein_coding / is_pseudo=false